MAENKAMNEGNKNQPDRGARGNAGNAGTGKGFDEQHGIRGSQLNAHTTSNSGKSKDLGGAGPRKQNMMNNKKGK